MVDPDYHLLESPDRALLGGSLRSARVRHLSCGLTPYGLAITLATRCRLASWTLFGNGKPTVVNVVVLERLTN